MKKIITDRIIIDQNVDVFFSGTIGAIQSRMFKIVSQAKQNGMIDEGAFDIYDEGYYESSTFKIQYEYRRYETDNEYEFRLKTEKKIKEDEKKRKAAKREKEYNEYMRLKKQFENEGEGQ